MVTDQPSQLLPLLTQFPERAGPFLGGVRGHFAAIDGKELVAQQALLVADQQHLFEQLFDLSGVATDELRQRGEVRHRIAGQGLEDDVRFAAPLHLPTGGDALGVSEQNDLQQYGRVVSQSACVVVAVLWMEDRQVQLVLDQVMHGVFKGAGLKLFLVVDHDHGVLVVVVVFEAGHGRRVLVGASDKSMLTEPDWQFWDFFYSLNAKIQRRPLRSASGEKLVRWRPHRGQDELERMVMPSLKLPAELKNRDQGYGFPLNPPDQSVLRLPQRKNRKIDGP